MADLFPAIQEVAKTSLGSGSGELADVRRPLMRAIQVSFQPVEGCSGSFRVRHDGENIAGWLVETDQQVPAGSYDSSRYRRRSSGPDFARILDPLPASRRSTSS